jgi:hypothetical protein
MSTAVNEILKQVDRLSTDEQLELAAKLNERLERHTEPDSDNGYLPEPVEVAPDPQTEAEARLHEETEAEACLSEETEEDEIPDVFSLNRVPPKRTYTMHVKYKFVGRGKPRPYPLEDEE